MGELIDKAKGLANEVAGSAKKGVGELTNDPALQAEGELQKTKGKIQKAVGDAKGAAGDRI